MNARKVAEGVVPGFSEGPRSSRTVHSAALHAWLPPDAGSLLPAHLSRCSGPLISACSARRKNSSGRVRGAAASLPSCGTRKLPRLLGAAPLLPPTPKWPGCSCCSSEPCTASVTPRRRQGKPTCSPCCFAALLATTGSTTRAPGRTTSSGGPDSSLCPPIPLAEPAAEGEALAKGVPPLLGLLAVLFAPLASLPTPAPVGSPCASPLSPASSPPSWPPSSAASQSSSALPVWLTSQ